MVIAIPVSDDLLCATVIPDQPESMSQTDTTGIDPIYDEQDGYDRSSSRYPPDWDARKKAVQKRDDWTCTDCGEKSGPHAGDDGVVLDVHHIQHLSDGGSNRLDNLTTLCIDCHNDRHDHDIREGRDDYEPALGIWGWLRRLVRSIAGGVVVLLLHSAAVYALLSQPIGSPLWLAGGGWFVVSTAVLVVRPKRVTAVYTVAAVAGTTVLQGLSLDRIAGENAAVLLLSTWIPMLLATAWWYHQR